MEHQSPRGWYTRGYLPRYDGGSISQFITFRLFDSLPQNVLSRIQEEIALKNVKDVKRETLILAEKYLDKGYGQCFLRRREIAE